MYLLYIYDTVLAQIQEHIASHNPERGGALLGEPGSSIITKFIYDVDAETTVVSYSPSRQLNAKVKQMEESEELEFKGIVHSHPGSHDSPSYQDEKEIEKGLHLNRHMPFYLAPIVTRSSLLTKQRKSLSQHELVLDDGKISFFAGYRKEELDFPKQSYSLLSQLLSSKIQLKKMKIKLVPVSKFQKDLEIVCKKLKGTAHPNVYVLDNNGEPIIVGQIDVKKDLDLLVLIDCDYPKHPPKILVTFENGNQKEIPVKWSQHISEAELMEAAITTAIEKTPLNSKAHSKTKASKKEAVQKDSIQKVNIQPMKNKPTTSDTLIYKQQIHTKYSLNTIQIKLEQNKKLLNNQSMEE